MDITIYFVNDSTHLCTWVLRLRSIIWQYCPFFPRGFCCGKSSSTNNKRKCLGAVRSEVWVPEAPSGSKVTVTSIQLCGELLSAHQPLVECFVYNLIQQHVGSVKSCSVLGSEGLLTDARFFHYKVS